MHPEEHSKRKCTIIFMSRMAAVKLEFSRKLQQSKVRKDWRQVKNHSHRHVDEFCSNLRLNIVVLVFIILLQNNFNVI